MKLTTKQRKKELLKAFEDTVGNVSMACRKVGCSRDTFYSYRNKDKKFAASAKEIRDEFSVDYVENKFLSRIKEGDTTACIFFLKTRGKHRGYGDSADISLTGKDGGPIGFFDAQRIKEADTE